MDFDNNFSEIKMNNSENQKIVNIPQKLIIEIKKTKWEKFFIFFKIIFRIIIIFIFLGLVGMIFEQSPKFSQKGEFEMLFVNKFDTLVEEKIGQPIVARIPVNGIISGETTGIFDFIPAETIIRMLDFAEKDINIKMIILEIDSPGGTVFDTQRIVEKIEEIKEIKPIIALVKSNAASGGYFLAAACNKIFTFPESMVGSIGVLVQIPNASEFMDKVGIKMFEISSGEFKTSGSPFSEFSEIDKTIFQKMVNETHQNLVKQIATQRNLEISEVQKIANGRIFSATQAKELGLIDSFDGHESIEKFFQQQKLFNVNYLRFTSSSNFWGNLPSFLTNFFQGGIKKNNSNFLAQ